MKPKLEQLYAFVWILSAVSFLLFPSSATGEEDEKAGRDVKEVQSKADRLMPGQSVRISTQLQGDLAGKFQRNTVDSLYVGTDSGVRSLSVTAVDALWVRENARGTGMVIGGTTGFLAMAVLAAGADHHGEGGQGSAILLAGVAGGIVGGFLGSMVGWAVPQWKAKYRSSQYTRRSSSGASLDLLGGPVPGKADPVIEARLMVKSGSSSFRWGIDYIRFGDEYSFQSTGYESYTQAVESQTRGLSILVGKSFSQGWIQPYALFGISVLRDREFVSRHKWDDSGSLVDLYEYEETSTIPGFSLTPGLGIGGGNWQLLVEGRYQALARAAYDDFFAVVVGMSFRP